MWKSIDRTVNDETKMYNQKKKKKKKNEAQTRLYSFEW